MPVFGAEMLIANRKLKDRFKRYRKFLNTVRGFITVIGLTGIVAYAFTSIVASIGTDADVGYYFIYLIGLLVIPVYASFNSLAIGIQSLTDALDRNVAADWVAAGVSPKTIACQLLLVRSYRQFPAALIYAFLFAFAFLMLMYREAANDKISIWQVLAIIVAFVTFQYMFIATASFFAVLVKTLAGRFLLVSGYYLTHLILPIVLVAVFSENLGFWDYEEVLGTALFSVHPYGPLFLSVFLSEGPIFDVSTLSTYFISLVFQFIYTMLFLSLATMMFVKKVLE